jgi:N-acetylglucosamine-6-phosphate deacetylase
LGELEVELSAEGRVRLAGQETLAGSALRMDRGIENLMQIAGLSLREAVTMASRNPARVARITGRQRGLAPGDRADFVQLRFEPRQKRIRIEKTFLSGREVYSAAA